METRVYWKDALEMLKQGMTLESEQVNFNQEQVPVRDVAFFNKHAVRVPQDLVCYDDETIDCSDIPEITDDDISSGKIQWISLNEFPMDNEIRTWIKSQNIKLNELLPYLLENFYHSIKFAHKNVAF